MSVIFVNTGQCGNQVGFDVIDGMFGHLSDGSAGAATPRPRPRGGAPSDDWDSNIHPMDGLYAFFRPSSSNPSGYTARAVCVDTEPKVVLNCMSQCRRRGWRLDPARAVFSHGGAGNNWAMGYQMGSGKLLDTALDSIRLEMELCDAPPVLLFSHSLGGGTGSGLGTRLCEEAADEFPDAFKLSAAVMPYHFGEVIVQHYNSLLCLAKVGQAADGVMLFDNEVAHEVCRSGFGKEKPALRDLNAVIAAGLIAAISPKYRLPPMAANTRQSDRDGAAPNSSTRRFYSLNEQLAHLCSHPGYKFMDVKVVPQTSERSVSFTYDSWRALMGRLQRMEAAGSASETVSHQRPLSAPIRAEASPRSTAEEGDVDDFSVIEDQPSHRVCGQSVQVASVLTLRGPDAPECAASLRVRASTESPSDGGGPFHDAPNSSSSSSASIASSSARHRYASDTQSSVTRAHLDPRLGQNSSNELEFQVQCAPWSLHGDGGMSPSSSGGSVSVACSARSLNGYHRSASLISNGQSVLPLLRQPLVRAAHMYRCGAYLHQYTGLGIEEGDFEEAFLGLGQVVQNYQALSL